MASRPPKPQTQRSQKSTPTTAASNNIMQDLDFDKAQWIKDLKSLGKDANIEERDRFRPLLKMKHDSKETLDELQRLEKK